MTHLFLVPGGASGLLLLQLPARQTAFANVYRNAVSLPSEKKIAEE